MKQREGVLVKPYNRLTEEQVGLIDALSKEILEEVGLVCYSREAASIFEDHGGQVEEEKNYICVRIPARLVEQALETAPSRIVLGARDPDNRLVLDGHEPRVRFGSGSETNFWLNVDYEGERPVFTKKQGSLELLGRAAHLAEYLQHLDFFIRCVNVQDKEITPYNKDVNKFFTCFNNTSKHVQGGLTSLEALEDVLAMAEMVSGGRDAFRNNPIVSFIVCLIKSPLQVVDDSARTFIRISKERIPLVLSSSPMGGATAPFDEMGMVAQINAELLAGITLNQLIAPEAPILYGAVPVRVRLDNLNDMYAAPEYIHYNESCAQMARYYGIPCYSAMGVADSDVPGIQATAEKMATVSVIPRAGAQYIHYAFGLLERTNTFCPEQAIMDDTHIGLVKYNLATPDITAAKKESMKTMIQEVMATEGRTFLYSLPRPTQEDVYIRYPLESRQGDALLEAFTIWKDVMERERNQLPAGVRTDIRKKISGIIDNGERQST
jgi:trimethylamine--corrinoid protein Co-methyltransferase